MKGAQGAIGLLSTILVANSLWASSENFDLKEHTEAQIRAGYIMQNNKGGLNEEDSKAFALGGHLGIKSERIKGFLLEAEFYTVRSLGLNNSDPQKINPDFFDADKSGFTVLSKAYIDYTYKNTKIKIGRQLIDTPHADSDDIRMMPNYFNAYMLINKDIPNVTLTLGKIDKMAGWENGTNPSKFTKISDILGIEEDTEGIYLASAIYEKENFNFQIWYYDLDKIANVFYLESGYKIALNPIDLSVSLQYDKAQDRKEALLGKVDSSTWGAALQIDYKNISLMGAYNKDSGDTGPFQSDTFGGGAFFTSLEDQTIDGMGEKGEAWVLGAMSSMDDFVKGLSLGAIYGEFQAREKTNYNTSELDIIAEYSYKNISLSGVYAKIDDKTVLNEDYDIFRIIVNYDF